METSPDMTMGEELRARGWMYLRELGQPSPELNAWSRAAPYHYAAARLADGLVLRDRTARGLLALIDAVMQAAERGTVRPAWVPVGLGYDPERKLATFPEAVPLRLVPPPRLPSPAEVCAEEGHIPSVRKAGICGSCGQPFVSVPRGGTHGQP